MPLGLSRRFCFSNAKRFRETIVADWSCGLDQKPLIGVRDDRRELFPPAAHRMGWRCGRDFPMDEMSCNGSDCRLSNFIVRSKKAGRYPSHTGQEKRVELIAVKRLVYAGFRGHRSFKTCGRLGYVPAASPRRAIMVLIARRKTKDRTPRRRTNAI